MSRICSWSKINLASRRPWAVAAFVLAAFSSSAAALTISRAGDGEVELAWRAAEERAYQLQHSGDLSEWLPLGSPVLGAGSPVALRDEIAGSERKFYRLQENRVVRVATGAELIAAVADAEPGDNIVLADGTWHDRQLTVQGEGAPGRPIWIRAETPGEVVFTGASSFRVRGSHIVVEGLSFRDGYLATGHVIDLDGEHLRLTETAIDSYNPPDRETRYFWVSLRGRHNQVDRCTFRGMDHSGVTLVVWREDDSPNDHLIRRNYFADRPEGTGNGWETIRIGTSQESLSASRTVVEENLFERCDGEIEIISNKAGENIYRRNTFRASRGTLTLRHGDRCVVDSNFFFGENITGTGGIRVIGEDHIVVNNYIEATRGRGGAAIALNSGIPDSPLHGYHASHGALVAFNTVVDAFDAHVHLAHLYGDGGRTVLPERVTIANNLFEAGSHTGGTIGTGEAGEDLTVEGNIAYRRPLGSLPADGATVANPRLERGEGGLWRPRADSPVIGAAAGSYPEFSYDIDGQPRDDPKDVGCDERSDAPILNRPLFPEDVGASWAR